VLGLLGPNGAGKSTLMRILATITRPTVGRVLWNGTDIKRDPDALRTVLGYLPQDFGIYPNLSALEFLGYLAAVKGLDAASASKRIGELLELVNLTYAARRPLGGFSGGMRQRVGIAQALLNDPKLLIVDEPTAGLDPEERVRFRNLLSELSGERIVILSTHIVSDVEAVATDIALIVQGELVVHGVPEALLAGVNGKVWEVVVPSGELAALRQRHLISNTAHRSDGVHARVVSDAAPGPGARSLEPSLEDAYLAALATHRNGAHRLAAV
jgi:ABC-type multidrug transport system ATPase subunit